MRIYKTMHEQCKLIVSNTIFIRCRWWDDFFFQLEIVIDGDELSCNVVADNIIEWNANVSLANTTKTNLKLWFTIEMTNSNGITMLYLDTIQTRKLEKQCKLQRANYFAEIEKSTILSVLSKVPSTVSSLWFSHSQHSLYYVLVNSFE